MVTAKIIGVRPPRMARATAAGCQAGWSAAAAAVPAATVSASKPASIVAGTSERPIGSPRFVAAPRHDLLDRRQRRGAVDAMQVERFPERMTAAAAEIDAERSEHAERFGVGLDQIANCAI